MVSTPTVAELIQQAYVDALESDDLQLHPARVVRHLAQRLIEVQQELVKIAAASVRAVAETQQREAWWRELCEQSTGDYQSLRASELRRLLGLE